MGSKRKRSGGLHDPPRKRPSSDPLPCTAPQDASERPSHPVLRCYYRRIATLREYLLTARLSTKARQRVARAGALFSPTSLDRHDRGGRVADVELGKLLDSTWIGLGGAGDVAQSQACRDGRWQALREQRMARHGRAFWQQSTPAPSASMTSPTSWANRQSEIVEFVIDSLFKRSSNIRRPSHLLCQGAQWPIRAHQSATRPSEAAGILGLDSNCTDRNAAIVRGSTWSRLLSLLGNGGEECMIELLLYPGIFLQAGNDDSNLCQISGIPLHDLETLARQATNEALASASRTGNNGPTAPKSPAGITLVRSRMFYARPALSPRNQVQLGLRQIHVLNRLKDVASTAQTVHLMKYVFPRQFGLHNVFTSSVDHRETTQPFKDYTLREKEIAQSNLERLSRRSDDASSGQKLESHLPKRLRGEALLLVHDLRKRHSRCSYVELLRYYCGVRGWRPQSSKGNPSPTARRSREAAAKGTQCEIRKQEAAHVEDRSFMDFATPASSVSAFCRAVVRKVVPNGFWGHGESGERNRDVVMLHVDRFIGMRRSESLNLHEIIQNIKIADIPWLATPGRSSSDRMALSDFNKRKEIFLEFIYYLFDSFLIPLVHSNFYVTETNPYKMKLFYFTHDTWRWLTEPSIRGMQSSVFDELTFKDAMAELGSNKRLLGHSNVRLLPKSVGVRSIANLKRRMPIRQYAQIHGKRVLVRTTLGRSINSVLAPAFGILKYENAIDPQRLGSSLFWKGDLLPKLQKFRASLESQGLAAAPLYFVKVDVQSCFDSIPQERLVNVVNTLLSDWKYRTRKHVEIRPTGHYRGIGGKRMEGAPTKRFLTTAESVNDSSSLEQALHERLQGKSNTVIMDVASTQVLKKDDVIKLIREHVEGNIVRIGKTYHKQRKGIPQGSVLSTLLCNVFYSEFERDRLDFLTEENSLLSRQVDDFLLVTVNRDEAIRFLQVMLAGDDHYGVSIKKDKTMANFDVSSSSPRSMPRRQDFPYCGVLINTVDLNVRKDSGLQDLEDCSNALTIDYSKSPGQAFRRKTLNAFRVQMLRMFLDTAFNSIPTVLSNLFDAFFGAATRCFYYLRGLPKTGYSTGRFMIDTVYDLVRLAQGMMRKQARRPGCTGYECTISTTQTKWLAGEAFRIVFHRRQTRHTTLLALLKQHLNQPSAHLPRAELDMMDRAIQRVIGQR